jgi:hypothetical protein
MALRTINILALMAMVTTPLEVKGSNEKQAVESAGIAFYKQAGLEKFVEELQNKYQPEFLTKHGGFLIGIEEAARTQRIEYKLTWRW